MRKAMTLALLSNQHCLVVGPKGVGKTAFHDELFNALDLDETEKAVISGYKGAGEEILLNYLNPGKLEDGEFEYLPGPSILNRKLVYVDEVEKLARLTQQILLQVMQSRRFSRAGVDMQLPLDTLFGGGNGVPEDPAVRDRFGIQIPLERNERLIRDVCQWAIDRRSLHQQRQRPGSIEWELVLVARREAQDISVSDEAQSLMTELAIEFELSPRRVAQVLVPVARASAYINHRSEVESDDVFEIAPFVVLHDGELTEERFQRLAERFAAIAKKNERKAAIRRMQHEMETARERVLSALSDCEQSLSRNSLKAMREALASLREMVERMPSPDTVDEQLATVVAREMDLAQAVYRQVLNTLGLTF